jgi:hypothetical protein
LLNRFKVSRIMNDEFVAHWQKLLAPGPLQIGLLIASPEAGEAVSVQRSLIVRTHGGEEGGHGETNRNADDTKGGA